MSSELVTWRLITQEEGEDGFWNMALDEALLCCVAEGKSLPTLRLYAWDQPTVSLGFAQPVRDVNLERITYKGWGLVRRPTGGRAILHTDEITYSVTASQQDPLLAGNLLESYHRISAALLAGLTILGIEANGEKEYPNDQNSLSPDPICFNTPSNYEITTAGKKLIGSAQARKYGGILQHGAIPLFGNITRLTEVLCFENEFEKEKAASSLIARASTLADQLGYPPLWQEVAAALQKGFEATFGISFIEQPISAEEKTLATQLAKNKYASEEWTFRW